MADAGNALSVLEQFLPIELPARVVAGRLYPGSHAEVARLPQVHHLFGVLGAPLHVLRMTGEERPEVDDAHNAFTQLARYTLHHRHHLRYEITFVCRHNKRTTRRSNK